MLEKNQFLWAKTKPNAIIPTKRDEDAGYDIYACFEEEHIVIQPNETVIIPTGIASAFHPSKVVVLHERGSTGTKGIGQRSGIIDSGYRGEWMIPVTNHNNCSLIISKHPSREGGSDIIVYPYEKALCQALILDIPTMQCETVDYDELLKHESLRGTGRLGSSEK